MLLELEQPTRLSPARILQVDCQRVQLEFPDEFVWADMALAIPYQAAVGDTVLAIGQGEAWYVIGVLQGSGRTTLAVPGDLSIRSASGAIELTAPKGIRLKSPTVRLVSDKLEVMARSVFERFAHATRWVKETFQLRSGRLRTRVDGTYDMKAERIVERASGDVKIDGEQIKLG